MINTRIHPCPYLQNEYNYFSFLKAFFDFNLFTWGGDWYMLCSDPQTWQQASLPTEPSHWTI